MARPKIALRKDSAGKLDDIVVEPVEMFRMEFMDNDSLWICCYLPNGERIAWMCHGKRLKLNEWEMPESGTWEDWDAARTRGSTT